MPRAPKPTLLLGAGLLGLSLVLACGEPPQLSGQVLDIWGKPIEGATVAVEGIFEQAHTDVGGAFKMVAPLVQARVMAGKDGYIPEALQAPTLNEDQDDPEPLAFHLYPEPEHPGFYAVGREAYQELEGVRARTMGTEVRAFTGVPDIGESTVSQDQVLTFVFTTTLRRERLAQLDLKLHRLEFIDESRLPGVLGDTNASVELWTAVGEPLPYDLVGLASRDDFLIKLREKLPRGVYAFHTQDVLTDHSYEALDKLPKELRMAYVFELR